MLTQGSAFDDRKSASDVCANRNGRPRGVWAPVNLRALQLFRQIVLTGSLGKASLKLNVSASAASRMLAQLEHDLGLTLFSRVRRNLDLTEDGALFFRQVVNTLAGIDEISALASDIRRRTEGWLSVVTAAPLANGLVVPAMGRMRRDGVAFNGTVNVESRFDIESKVAARSYNLGLISLPVENAIIELDVVPFLKSRMCVLMPADHPLAARDEIRVDDLFGAEFATLAPDQLWRARLEAILGAAGRQVDATFETGSTLVTVEMVRAGLGLTLIDAVCAPPMPSPGLAMRPVAGNHFVTYASLHPPVQRMPLSERFLDAIAACVDERRATEMGAADLLELI